MPASRLVTRPPRPMSKNVATAFSTANQNNAGWYLLFIIGKERPLWIVSRSGRWKAEKLFYFKREVLRRAGVFDFDFGGLHAEFAVRGFKRVFARRHVFDGEFPTRAAYGKIRMIKHADPREHPRMHVALEFQERLRLVKGEIQIRAAGHLHQVLQRIFLGHGVDVMD